MKAFFKSKILVTSAAVVLVAAVAATSFLLVPKSAAAAQGKKDSDTSAVSSADPAGTDVQLESDSAQVVAPTDSQGEKTIPADESQPVTKPSAENGKVEDGSKAASSKATPPADKVESGTKTAPSETSDSSTAGGTDSKEDSNSKPGDEPHYGADTSNPPSNNIDSIPDYSIDDTPGDTSGAGKPGDGTKF